MSLSAPKALVPILTILLGVIFCAPLALGASHHLVSVQELRQAAQSAAQKRQAQVAQVERFFSSELARRAFRKAHLSPVEIRKAVPALSDRELARLSAETQKVQSDFAAGSLSNQQITYILIAMGTALLVTIIFVS
jgi:tRNA A37 threonylcarbamoyladenosine modification protein TsaB